MSDTLLVKQFVFINKCMVSAISLSSYYEKFLATGEVKCIDDEIPFEIPKGWEWCRLKHMCSMQAGKNISASEIYDKKSVLHPYRCVGGNGLRGFTNTFNAEGHFAIIGRQGALCGCLNIESGKFYATEHAVVVNGFGIIPSLFIYYFFTALNLNQYATATAQPGLAVSNIVEVFIPLPPLPEQLRIVSKIEKLLPLVKTYEQAQNGLNELNASLNEQLRKSILQEAIQGKLVPQCSDEGTAQELLEQIKLEKQKLIKDGKLKKSALTDSVIFKGDDNKYYEQVGNENIDITEEIPFDLPENWTWVRFGQYVRMSIGKTPPRGETKYWANGKYPWVSISDMSDYGLVTTTKESVSEYAKSLFGEISPVGTLIMSFKLTVGRTSLLNTSAYHNEAIISIYPFVDKNYQARNFLFHILPIISNLGDTKDAIKGKTLNSKSLNNLLLPLPPLNEQGRIVAMIELLFDKLK
ncbi:restriction endonuclease subunit S [Phocaeicola vulgatus]|nr:restriction endonuclease subunit S [Phocaeicola vulgatus]KAB6673852.1 restriction endonuclease subunit S [Phocaeicola vulgatus]